MAVAENLIVPERDQPALSVPASAVASARVYFVALSLLGLAAFMFGVENRFTAAGLFALPPPVDLVPPLSGQAWSQAFAIHQQDPVFAVCGGTESLAQFKLLYWWEWLRRASLAALTAGAGLALLAACVRARHRVVLPRLLALATLAAAWWPARVMVELAVGASAAMSSFNVGQYRHAVDVVFASAALAGAIASAFVPPRADLKAAPRRDRAEWPWIVAIVADICFGALFAACNAAAFWSTWPGYDGHVLPPLSWLVSYAPWWLNVTFNPYGIQLIHRALSGALWIAAAWQLGAALLRGMSASRAAARFALISVQALTGIATLVLGVPALLSIAHQVGAIALLAASLAFWLSGRARPSAGLRLVAPRVDAGAAA